MTWGVIISSQLAVGVGSLVSCAARYTPERGLIDRGLDSNEKRQKSAHCAANMTREAGSSEGVLFWPRRTEPADVGFFEWLRWNVWYTTCRVGAEDSEFRRA